MQGCADSYMKGFREMNYWIGLFSQDFLEFFGQSRHYLKDVSDNTISSDFEYRRVRIFIDRDDHLG